MYLGVELQKYVESTDALQIIGYEKKEKKDLSSFKILAKMFLCTLSSQKQPLIFASNN